METKTKKHGLILSYDRCQTPKGMKFKDVAKLVKEAGICVYDGSVSDYRPTVVDLGGGRNENFRNLKMIDISKF